MVGHQAIGVDLATQFLLPFPEIFQIIGIVIIAGKNTLAVMITLDHEVVTVGKNEKSVVRHGGQ